MPWLSVLVERCTWYPSTFVKRAAPKPSSDWDQSAAASLSRVAASPRSGESLADINAAALCLPPMSFITDIVAPILASALVITLAVFGAGALIERVAPAETTQPRAHRWLNIAYTVAFTAI